MNAHRKIIVPLVILFILFNGFFLTSTNFFNKWHVDRNVLLVANSLLFVLSMISFLMHQKALQNKNPNVFVRSIMGGMMIKMLVCAVAVLAYVLLNRDNYNKRALFAAMFLYLFYLAVEVKVLMKLNKQKNA